MDHPFMIHDLSPYIVHFGGGYGLRWYGMAYLAGLVASYLLVLRGIKKGTVPLTADHLQDAVMHVGIGMMVGGRLAYCIFYYTTWHAENVVAVSPPWAFLQDPLYLFRVWEGGMASHGGLAGMAAGALVFCYRRKYSFPMLCDLIAITAPIGVICGRIANFINGELWGRTWNGDPSPKILGWVFPESLPGPLRAELLTLKKGSEEWYAFLAQHAQAAGVRHPSQLYAVALEGVLPLVTSIIVHRLHRRPGLTAGACIIAYSVGRFVGEFWREPDAGYALIFGWMSKGQMLTIPLAAAGLAVIIWAMRRGPKPEAYLRPEAIQAGNAPTEKAPQK